MRQIKKVPIFSVLTVNKNGKFNENTGKNSKDMEFWEVRVIEVKWPEQKDLAFTFVFITKEGFTKFQVCCIGNLL